MRTETIFYILGACTVSLPMLVGMGFLLLGNIELRQERDERKITLRECMQTLELGTARSGTAWGMMQTTVDCCEPYEVWDLNYRTAPPGKVTINKTVMPGKTCHEDGKCYDNETGRELRPRLAWLDMDSGFTMPDGEVNIILNGRCVADCVDNHDGSYTCWLDFEAMP